MKAIIFGVTGQDGSYLAELQLEKDYEVIGVCRRSSVNNPERIKHLLDIEGLDLVTGDVTDVSSITNILLENPDVNEIYNLAAQSHVGVSFKQPGTTWDITGKGCLNILQSIVDVGLDARFYQASSSEMCGDSYDIRRPKKSNGEVYEDKYQDEMTRFTPQSPYAVAKVAAHQAVRLYRQAYNLHGSCGILFNHESPRRGETFVTRKITIAAARIRMGLQDELYLGNLLAKRDWGYAGDYVKAMWLMLQQDEPDDLLPLPYDKATDR